MHVTLLFAGEELTDREARLVHAVAEWPSVERVTLGVVARRHEVLDAAQRWRATIERIVARASVVLVTPASLASEKIKVQAITRSELELTVRAFRADSIVNLSGVPLGAALGAESDILELWWDGVRPINLGVMRAWAPPPRDLVVTIRRRDTLTLRVACRSRLTRTVGTDSADRRNASSRSLVLLLRALRSINRVNNEPWRTAPPVTASLGVHLLETASATFAAVTSALWRRSSRVLWRGDAWELRYRTTNQQFVTSTRAITADGFKAYRAPYDRFYADPIAFNHDGMTVVFMEEYLYQLGRGVISYARLEVDGTLSKPQRILERAYHLSYPFVFRDGPSVYMIPETSDNRSVELYRCVRFPTDWVLERTLLTNIALTDATVYFDGKQWWMFATKAEEGSYAWDELHLFMAETPAGEWLPHPANPVKIDARSARPAGPLFWKDGRLLRPTQDCSSSYGGALNLCEVEVLTSTEFREREVGRLSPEVFGAMNGLHTLSATQDLEVIDVRPLRRTRWTK